MASLEQRTHSHSVTWRVVWRQDGRKQTATFGSADLAERYRRKVEAYGNQWPPGDAPDHVTSPDVLTFAEWAEQAIVNRTRATERTKSDYRRDMENHFQDMLDLPIDGITESHVTKWVAQKQAAKLSPKTIRNLHGFASSVFADAMNQHPPLTGYNPFARKLGQLAQVRTEEMVFMTPSEFGTVLANVLDEYRPLTRLLAGTGLRFGEATALLVRDVDLLDRKALTVTKAWKRTGTSEYVVGEPKTPRSRRTLSLPPELVELLIPLVSGRRGDELLFASHGGRLPHSEFYKRGWAPAIARSRVCDSHYAPQRDKRGKRPRLPLNCHCAGVLDKSPRIHDIRHSHASWLIAAGVPLPAISRRLGHSSISITVDRYGHLDPSMDAQVNAAVEAALTSR